MPDTFLNSSSYLKSPNLFDTVILCPLSLKTIASVIMAITLLKPISSTAL